MPLGRVHPEQRRCGEDHRHHRVEVLGRSTIVSSLVYQARMLRSWGLSPKADQDGGKDDSDVTLVGFTARQQSTRLKPGARPTSLSRNARSTQDITYSLNSQPRMPSDELVAGNKVTLVGFLPWNSSFKQSSGVRRCESFALSTKEKRGHHQLFDVDGDFSMGMAMMTTTAYSPYSTNTLKTSKELKMEREGLRQEKLSQFRREAQNWWKQAERSELSKTTSSSNGFDYPFFAAFDKMMGSGAGSRMDDFMKFFSEAERRFANSGGGGIGSRESSFTKFFANNRKRFTEMDEMRRWREENFLSCTSDFYGFFDKVTADWRRANPFATASPASADVKKNDGDFVESSVAAACDETASPMSTQRNDGF